MTVPARAHFCWIGPQLPWAYVFAVLSAAERSALPEIFLHHTDTLKDGAELRALRSKAGVQLIRLDPAALLAELGDRLGVGGELAALYDRLVSPVPRADILRGALLHLHGGIYLDLDTITVASLRPLLAAPQFVGAEFIVWPLRVRQSRSPLVWARHLSLDVTRKILRKTPGGWRGFRRIQNVYFRGINNAVMGAEPGSRLIENYLRAALAVPAEQQGQAYRLGTDLLQEVVDGYEGDDLVVHDPRVFYPLPPEISEHWFRLSRKARLNAVLSAETRIVHWYASVRTKSRVARITPEYVRRHRDRQLYSALVCACIDDLP